MRPAKRAKYNGSKDKSEPLVITVEPDGSDAWRLDAVAELINDGAVSAALLLFPFLLAISHPLTSSIP